MSGYSDRAAREIWRRVGCELVIVPLISAEGLVRDDPKTWRLVDIVGEAPPVAVQVFGRRPEALAEAARRIEAAGVSGVDLNLGCPARKVVRHDNGAGLLKHPGLVREIVASMRRAVAIALTVKIRAGWDEGSPPAEELARIIEGEGADAIAIHGRTGRQMFRGAADWRSIAAVKAAVSIPVIGNGDVRSHEDAWRMVCETGCDGVMIGRAAIGNPWLLRDARIRLESGGRTDGLPEPPTPGDRIEMMLEHLRMMVRFAGEPRAVIEFRKHAVHYLKGIAGAKLLKSALLTARTLGEVEKAVSSASSSIG
jgi:nifR3 family TIM-barrel protein